VSSPTQNVSESVTESQPKYCKACWCNKKDSIDCKKADQLDSLPILKTEAERLQITEIIIEKQSQFKNLSAATLSLYPALEKISISQTGLESLPLDVFSKNPLLKEIKLDKNQIRVIPWKVFDPLGQGLLALTLNDNPLVCNCSSKWIQRQIGKEKSRFGPEGEHLDCYDDLGARILFTEVEISGCDVPEVQVVSPGINITETEVTELQCTASGQPQPVVYWNTTLLVSNFTTKTFKSMKRKANCTEDCELTEVQSILTLTSAHGADNGYIECIAENIVGRGKDEAHLIINSPPRIRKLELQKRFYWCIHFVISGFPSRNHTWYFNNVFLNVSTNSNFQDLPDNNEAYAKSLYYSEGQ
jgi:hypothetical protein